MGNNQKVAPSVDVNGGNFEAKSLEDFIEQMKRLQLDGWQICHIKAFVGVKKYPEGWQESIVSQQ